MQFYSTYGNLLFVFTHFSIDLILLKSIAIRIKISLYRTVSELAFNAATLSSSAASL